MSQEESRSSRKQAHKHTHTRTHRQGWCRRIGQLGSGKQTRRVKTRMVGGCLGRWWPAFATPHQCQQRDFDGRRSLNSLDWRDKNAVQASKHWGNRKDGRKRQAMRGGSVGCFVLSVSTPWPRALDLADGASDGVDWQRQMNQMRTWDTGFVRQAH
jgi:hypothetical protein